MIDELPDELSAAVLERMRPHESGEVENLLEYREQTAGRIMNPTVFALSEDLTAGEAIQALQGSREVEMVFYLYVVDERRHLVGVVSLRRLLLVAPETPLQRIMTTDLISARVETDQEEVAQHVASYNLLAIPVVDEENKLVGIITVDDVIDIIKDEATEDLYRLAGVSGDEHVFTPRRRVGAEAPAVARHEPRHRRARRVRGAGVPGDHRSGRDARRPHDHRRQHGGQRRHPDPDRDRAGHRAGRAHLGQLAQGGAEGGAGRLRQRRLALGSVGALVAWLLSGNVYLGAILALAMVINLLVAAVAATLIPIALRALKVDPALASAVFITTLTDVFGFFAFLGLATLFLPYLDQLA